MHSHLMFEKNVHIIAISFFFLKFCDKVDLPSMKNVTCHFDQVHLSIHYQYSHIEIKGHIMNGVKRCFDIYRIASSDQIDTSHLNAKCAETKRFISEIVG